MRSITALENANELIDELEKEMEKLVKVTEDLTKAEEDYELRKLEVMSQVATAIDPATGKLKYSNEDSRKAAYAAMAINHSVIQTTKAKVVEQRVIKGKQAARVEAIRLQISLYKAYLYGDKVV